MFINCARLSKNFQALGQNCNCNDFRACVDLADATEKQNGKDCEAKCAVTAFGSKSNDAINCMQEKKALKESMKTQMKNCLFTTGNMYVFKFISF